MAYLTILFYYANLNFVIVMNETELRRSVSWNLRQP